MSSAATDGMSSAPLSPHAFPAWARLNGLVLDGIELRHIPGKGLGLVQEEEATTAVPATLLRVPRDLVLCVDDYANVDVNFKQLLEAVGHQSTRLDVILFLLCHLVQSRRCRRHGQSLVPTPWTEYLRFLPRPIPVPTMWSECERLLLTGTSLEPALEAKLAALTREFDVLRLQTEAMAFWKALLWEGEGSASLDDWILADGWFRSRCLELPHVGIAMVPGLDMVNHAICPTAYYEVDDKADVVLSACSGRVASCGREVTISYGQAKSAAEMLFSYGFIDAEASGVDGAANGLTLPIAPLSDDPLAKAKLRVFGQSPVVRLSWEGGALQWESPFAYLVCLNEEDGLGFRLLQDTVGERQLRLLWQDQDITGRATELESLIEGHSLCQVFRLRAVALVHERVETQLARVRHVPSQPLEARDACAAAAYALREVETGLLEAAAGALEHQKSMLLARDDVVRYLASMADGGDEDEVEDDFS
ncbi:hypothetical protein XA68_17335 [Ophiocordyceps unilateralis]|uniref:SET domain-containing protein n=1 Tax=Ophiocordyceps unilateralis TaxID=268505 RepID=A0A2A9P3E3_OPHUN|nr:hypothetical protein XA68_17335 [Ophiocordyceps unilateralis]